jgi:hypothetical protein
MPAIPDYEPLTVTAGDTLAWTKSVSDYPATAGWTLHYAIQAPTPIAINATASGANYAVNVAATTSVSYTPGVFLWTSYVTNVATARHVIENGQITILANPAVAQTASHAVRTLALIRAALEGRIPRGLEHTNIDGQELARIPIMDLNRLEVYYQNKVAGEQNRARIAAGLGNNRNHFARFTRP